jgi:hypothetical protein
MKSIYKAIFIILLPFFTFAKDLPYQAWFLKIRFTPKDTIIEGINIHEIDSTFIKASILDDSLTNKNDPEYNWPSNNYKFTIEKDINGDGNNEKVMVGVYKDKNDSLGQFVLILSKMAKNKYKIANFVKMQGEAKFHVLFNKNNDVCWADCMECGFFCTIKYSKKKYYWDCPTGEDAEY